MRGGPPSLRGDRSDHTVCRPLQSFTKRSGPGVESRLGVFQGQNAQGRGFLSGGQPRLFSGRERERQRLEREGRLDQSWINPQCSPGVQARVNISLVSGLCEAASSLGQCISPAGGGKVSLADRAQGGCPRAHVHHSPISTAVSRAVFI